MLVTHNIQIDLVNGGEIPRVQVKQGDVMSRIIRISLLAEGKAWKIPSAATAVIRYHAHDADTMQVTRGVYDLMEDGSPAYIILDNVIEIMPVTSMMAANGLVTVDVVLMEEAQLLAIFNFEIYVNRAPADGVNAENEGYYRVATLDKINAEFDKLRAAIEAMGGGEYLA